MLTAALLALGLLAVIFAIDAGLRVQAKRAATPPIAIAPDSQAASPGGMSDGVEEDHPVDIATPDPPLMLQEQFDSIEELGVDSGFI